ncbi:MAG: deoxyribodipyrimidine photolyase [Bdellovibrio sp. CG10_big_fil_rev_8_21_14_0_10_47_8]|nr:MAG: deoxyribodipyrimidine photolyase [Bdellovibrio sp. CG10_big_fil_rev_8_21_14_0_10_47_8]
MKKTGSPMNLFWFRRDLRLKDNAGLVQALRQGLPVQPLFIFDTEILGLLSNPNDARLTFIHETLGAIQNELRTAGSDLWVFHGKPKEIFQKIFSQNNVHTVYTNRDYEPRARLRDQSIQELCHQQGVGFHSLKDQVIFEENEILTGAGKPYTIYTPYKKKWLKELQESNFQAHSAAKSGGRFRQEKRPRRMPGLVEMGFKKTLLDFASQWRTSSQELMTYATDRDFPALEATSKLGLHLRFGTVSVRSLVRKAHSMIKDSGDVWLSELIWREFFMQILFHFPEVEKKSFRPEYETMAWRKSSSEFQRWCDGQTGYPLVDAGMRELKATGYMHNRVRMVTASFLTKHLLMHWSLGEKYFARHLLDYELASNNGNWQWVAGTGCDAAPYFRIFNPLAQADRFDPDREYINKWVPELDTQKYPKPMLEHSVARDRALRAFSLALRESKKMSMSRQKRK